MRVRFTKCDSCCVPLLFVLHLSVWKLAEVLSKHMLIEQYWTLIYFSNKSSKLPFKHDSNSETKSSSPTETNTANRVRASRLFIPSLSSHQESVMQSNEDNICDYFLSILV